MLRAWFLLIAIYCFHGQMQVSAHLIRCTKDDIGLRFPHPSSCSLFVICTSKQTIDIRNCPKNFHFNQQEQVCDLPQRANCMKQMVEPVEVFQEGLMKGTTTSNVQEIITTSSKSSESFTTPQHSCGCTAKINTADDSEFKTTSEPLTIITSVPSTTSTSLESLITPVNCGCVVESSTEDGSKSETISEPFTTTTSVSTEPLTTTVTCGCTAEISTTHIFETETTPSTTSTSLESLITPVTCGCVVESSTEGGSKSETTSEQSSSTTSTSPEPLTTLGTCGCTAEGNIDQSTESATKTTEVSSSLKSTTTIETPTETSACGCGNVKSSTPDLPEPIITTSVPTVKPLENCDEACCGHRNGATFAMQGDCQSFIICLGQKQTVMKCPNNLHYSIKSGSCDFPQNANCQWSYMPPSGPAAGPSGTHCTYGGRCVGQPDGTTFANETNLCSSEYVVCQCECEVPRSCSAPLMYNSKNNVCDWPKNLGCK